MGLKTAEARANAVVLAKQLNPSVVTQLWLVDNGIVKREEFSSGCVFTDVFCNVVAKGFTLLVAPEQLQFTVTGDGFDGETLAKRVVGRLVETLPHTPFIACGLNFTWMLEPPEGDSLNQFSRHMFFDPQREACRQFDAENAAFGTFMSKPVLDGTLTFQCKPEWTSPGRGAMQCNFNFHRDLDRTDAESPKRICDLLGRWTEVKNMTMDMMAAITGDVE